MSRSTQKLRLFLRRWILREACNATSPEHERCVLAVGHDGSHVPDRGRGWAWG